jgi:hypothetical protein
MVYRLKWRDGVYREILDNGAAFYRNGDFSDYFGGCIDISDRAEMEAQLRQAQKMEAVGQLTWAWHTISTIFSRLSVTAFNCLSATCLMSARSAASQPT